MNIGDTVELRFGDNSFNQLAPGREATGGQEGVEPTYARDGLYRFSASAPNIVDVLFDAAVFGWKPEKLAQTYDAHFGGHTSNGHLRLVPKEGPVTAFGRIVSRALQDGTIDYVLYLPVTAQEAKEAARHKPARH